MHAIDLIALLNVGQANRNLQTYHKFMMSQNKVWTGPGQSFERCTACSTLTLSKAI